MLKEKHLELSVKINSIIILSFLGNEKRTDKRLHQNLCDAIHYRSANYSLDFIEIKSRLDFNRAILRILKNSIQKKIKPILHLEFHGSSDKGILLPSGEHISWIEFTNCIRPINIFTDFNLGVFLAGCHGSEALLNADITKESPYNFLISTIREVPAGALEDSTSKFYETAFETYNLKSATEELPNNFELYKSESLFLDSFREYAIKYCKGRKLAERCDSILTAALENMPEADKSTLRREIKRNLRDLKTQFYSAAKIHLGDNHRINLSFEQLENIWAYA